MDYKLISDFLAAVAANNNRPWFQDHRTEYLAAKAEFENGVGELIHTLSEMDSEIAYLTPKECCYRFNRDIRFSNDKSPYKRHFGAYICAHGRKSLRGGYYLHVQPGHCFVAVGSYWLPTNILTAMRNEIMGNTEEWLRCVENEQFIHLFGSANETKWEGDYPMSAKGFGLDCLKKAPKDFPKDYEYVRYLKMKDYCAWHAFEPEILGCEGWTDKLTEIFKVAKPMMDFVNSVVDDYE